MTLIAGVSRHLINPQKPLGLFGYPHTPRISTGVHDPLYASALYLNNLLQEVIIVSVDVLMLDHIFLNDCREQISSQTGIPSSHVLISTTHTHSAPVTMDVFAFRHDLHVTPPDKDYMILLHKAIIASAVEAHQKTTPSLLACTSVNINGVGRNRHDPDGPRDPEVGIIVVKSLESKQTIAISLIYSMHPTVLHEDSTLVTADFPGQARLMVEEYFRGAIVLYHTGPAGNLSPRYDVSGQTFDEATRLGKILSDNIIRRILKLQPQDYQDQIAVGAVTGMVSLPRRIFPEVEEAMRILQETKDLYAKLIKEGATHGPRRTAEVSVFGAEEMVSLAKAQAAGDLEDIYQKYTHALVQVIRLGETYLVGLPGELFVEYALEIKQNVSNKVFVISLANGELQGYIVTPNATGYEASFSLFTPQAGKIMVDKAIQLISTIG